MGHSSSKEGSHNERSKCFDFPMFMPSQSSLSPLRNDEVTATEFASGIKLSWLVASVTGSSDLTVQRILEEHVLPMGAAGFGLSSDVFGPATHIVLVHPSTSWRAFIAAILNHVCMEPKRMLTADAPLSPRSPLATFGPSVACQSHQARSGKTGEVEVWTHDWMHAGSTEHQYHSTYLHIDFLSPSLATAGSTVVSTPAPVLVLDHSVSGEAVEDVLARMSGEPQVVLVVDPAGAIFTDLQAIRAIAAAVTFFQNCSCAEDLQQQEQPQQHGVVTSTANATNVGSRPLRFQLASALKGADWAPVVTAFGRLPGLFPNNPAVVRVACEAILESARLQYNAHWPLLNIFASRASFSLEAEYGCIIAGGSVGAGTGGVNAAAPVPSGGAVPSSIPNLPQGHLLPGQIETAEKLAMIRVNEEGEQDNDPEGGNGGELGGGEGCGSYSRGQRPESLSGIDTFPQNLFGDDALQRPPPAVPPADAKTLDLLRRSRSFTERSTTDCATPVRKARLPGRSCSSTSVAARARTALSAGNSGGAPSGPCPVSAAAASGGSMMPPPGYNSRRGSGALSGASARGPRGVASSVSAGCRSNPNVVTVGIGAAQQGSVCSYQNYASALASVASSAGVCPEGTSHLVTFAVEAARRYAALLEAVGLWAAGSNVLETCLYAVGERWGHRSSRMAALLTQLGRLQQMQGLYRSAEVTWRQALEALDSIHGPYGIPVLQCQVALAQVLAALREPEAETMLREALVAMDTALGPTAPATLAAREAVANFLAQTSRWAEAEVAYQSLLQAMEEAPTTPTTMPAHNAVSGASSSTAAAGIVSQRQRQAGQSLSSTPMPQQQQQHGVARAPLRTRSHQQLLDRPGPGEGPGRMVPLSSAASLKPQATTLRKADSRLRMAWGSYPEAPRSEITTAAVLDGLETPALRNLGSGGGGASTSFRSATFQRTVLPPLQSTAVSPALASGTISPSVLPPFESRGTNENVSISVVAAETSPKVSLSRDGIAGGVGSYGRGVRGPCNADIIAWSSTAAALADVIAAVQREYGGVNELYGGMHLAGPEGSTTADLAALAAVCPRSGACIAAVVNVRRLTDGGALYDAALVARRSVLETTHPAMVDLQLQYARHLSSAREHSHAEEVCRSVLEQLMLAPPPGLRHRQLCGGSAGSPHPSELGVRQTLGSVLHAAGSLAAATAALTMAVELAERLVASGDLAAADMRRVEALDTLSCVLWQRAQSEQVADNGAGTISSVRASAAASAASVALGPSASLASLSYAAHAIEYKRQALELTILVCGERHARVMAGWVALGQMQEAAGDLAAAERAYECAAEVALYRHTRLSAATKSIFRQLQRVYQAQGRTADAQVLGHMYRLKGGLLSAAVAQPAIAAVQA